MLDFNSRAESGLTLFSAGRARQVAFRAAVEFIRSAEFLAKEIQIDSCIVLGEKISAYAQNWLERSMLEEGEAFSGKRVFTWKEWIASCARKQAIQEGRIFREASDLEEREFLRRLLSSLEAKDMLREYRGLWQEEKFFAELLRSIREFRRKGFSTPSAIENLRESLMARGEEGETLVKHDLWTILTTWQITRELELDSFLDQGSQINRLLKIEYLGPQSVFLLGVEDLGAAEIDWLHHVSHKASLYWPVAMDSRELARIFGSQRTEVSIEHDDSMPSAEHNESVSAQTIKLLQSTFSQANVLVASLSATESLKESKNSTRIIPLIKAHTIVEETRSASALLAEILDQEPNTHVQIIAPKSILQKVVVREAWTEFLPDITTGLFPARSVMDQGYISLFLNTLDLIPTNSKAAPGIDLLLALFEDQKNEVEIFVKELWERGCTKGLGGWREIAEASKTSVAKEFMTLIGELQSIFPANANCVEFAEAMETALMRTKLFELVRHATTAKNDRDAHAAISLLQKGGARLAVDYVDKYEFTDWLQELWILLSSTPLESVVIQDRRISVYTPGEWIPPAQNSNSLLRIVMYLSKAYDSSSTSPYFTKETDRQLLSDWGIKTSSQVEGSLYNWYKDSILQTDRLLVSTARFDAKGADLSESFLHHCADYKQSFWPDISSNLKVKDYILPQLELSHSTGAFPHYSASSLDRYYRCPFLFLVEKIFEGEDAQAELALDWSRLEEGNVSHKVLEHFFKARDVWASLDRLKDRLEIRKIFDNCFAQVCKEMDHAYYLGGPGLDRYAEARLSRKLWEFIESELDYLQDYPLLSHSKTEERFELTLPSGRNLKGSIDRIDFDEKNKRFLVWDYKSTSTPSNKEIHDGESLQLPLYIWASNELGFGKPAGGAFVSMQMKRRSEGVFIKEFCRAKKNVDEVYYESSSRKKLSLEEVPDYLESILQESDRRIKSIENGVFSVQPKKSEDCKRCGVRPACRIRESKFRWSALPAPANFVQIRELSNSPDFSKTSGVKEKEAKEKETKEKEIIFSPEQEIALTIRGKLVFLEASAGSGKTTILVEKYRREIQFLTSTKPKGLGLSPEQAVDSVLAVSFTEKSASEIKGRLMHLLLKDYGPGIALRGVKNVSTIHGLNQRMIREYAHLLGVDPMFEILDEIQGKEFHEECQYRFFTEVLDTADGDLAKAFETVFQHYSRGDMSDILQLLSEKRGFWGGDSELQEYLQTSQGGGKKNENEEEQIYPEAAQRELLLSINYLFQRFLKLYDLAKRARGVLDFNDLELIALQAKEHDEILQDMQKRFSLILVDEFQDTNSLQRSMIEAISRKDTQDRGMQNVFIVGDAKQSIYRFRSADVSVFQRLKQEAQQFGLVRSLDKNYRSQGAIVKFANAVSEKIFPGKEERTKDFEAELAIADAHREPEALPELWRFTLPEGETGIDAIRKWEAKNVVEAIRKLVDEGEEYPNIALLFAKLTNVETYIAALQAAGIPYVIESKRGFYTQSVVLDGVALLRSIYLKENRLARLALLRSSWFRIDISNIQERLDSDSLLHEHAWFKRLQSSRVELRPSIVLAKAYKEHPLYAQASQRVQMDKFIYLVEELESGLKSWGELVEQISDLTGWAGEKGAANSSIVPDPDSGNAVKLMTIHASKGLEFSSVLLLDLDGSVRKNSDIIRYDQNIGCTIKWRQNNGDFTFGASYESMTSSIREREEAESARLFYVAVTRAKNNLVLFQHAASPKKNGKAFSWGKVLHENEWGESLRIVERPAQVVEEPASEFGIEHSITKEAHEKSIRTQKFEFIDSIQNKDLVNLSVTELSSYVYCPEFHRLKFVQRWEDTVVDNWDVQSVRRPFTKQSEASRLLKKMGLSNKERGITVHRVLENLDASTDNLELWQKILYESYTAQGAPKDSGALSKLIKLDIDLVRTFIASPVGQELFYSIMESHAELPISLAAGGIRLSGAIDRVVRKEDGRWLVVDYKTASMDGAIERYTVQVQVYMNGLKSILLSRGETDIRIEGRIIDLFSGEGRSIDPFVDGVIDQLVLKLKEAYQNREQHFTEGISGCQGSKACLVCPYTSVCSMGRDFILNHTN